MSRPDIPPAGSEGATDPVAEGAPELLAAEAVVVVAVALDDIGVVDAVAVVAVVEDDDEDGAILVGADDVTAPTFGARLFVLL